jgi:hypothetical protein
MAFDVEAARGAGYSDAEIATFIGNQVGFDAPAALKSGYKPDEIVSFLSTKARPTAEPEQPLGDASGAGDFAAIASQPTAQKREAGGGRGFVNPPVASEPQPRPVTDRSKHVATELPLTDAMGNPTGQTQAVDTVQDPDEVGAVKSMAREAGRSLVEIPKAASLMGGGAVVAAEAVANAITGSSDKGWQDAYFRKFVQPLQDAQDWYALKPQEKQSTLAKISGGLGGLIADLPVMIASGGLSAESKLAQSASGIMPYLEQLTSRGFDAMRVIMVKAGTEKAQQVLEAGGSAEQAANSGLTAALTTGFQGGLPMSAEGGVLKRIATGVPVGASLGEGARTVQNAADPEALQRPFDLEGAVVSGVTGAAVAGTMGHASPGQARGRTDLGYEASPEPVRAKPVDILQAETVDEAIQKAREVVNSGPALDADLLSIRPLSVPKESPNARVPGEIPGVPAGADGSGRVDAAASLDGGVGADRAAEPAVGAEGVRAAPASDAVEVAGGERAGAVTLRTDDSGTLTAFGEPKALQRILKDAGITTVLPAKDGVVIGKSQADAARRALADFTGEAVSEPAREPINRYGLTDRETQQGVNDFMAAQRAAAPEAAAQGEPKATWVGRRGDGYVTEGDALMALPSRRKVEPDLTWKIETMPNGKFRLAGYEGEVGQSRDASDAQTVAVSRAPDAGDGGEARDGADAARAAADVRVASDTTGQPDQVHVRDANAIAPEPGALANVDRPIAPAVRGVESVDVRSEPSGPLQAVAPPESAAVAPTETPPLSGVSDSRAPAKGEVTLGGIAERPRLTNADLAGKSHEELDAMHADALAHNREVDLQAIHKFFGPEQAKEAEGWSKRRREAWLSKNETNEASDWMQERYINDELIAQHRDAHFDFDTESPQELGRSIAIKSANVDKPGFMESPEGRAFTNALRYAKEQGWSLDKVLEGMRSRSAEWAGADAPELFARLYKEATGESAKIGAERDERQQQSAPDAGEFKITGSERAADANSDQRGMFARSPLDENTPGGLTMRAVGERVRNLRQATVPEVRSIVDRLTAGVKDAPAIKVVGSTRELPGNAHADARGYFDGKTVYVVAGAHQAGSGLFKRVAITSAHEIVGHWGMQRLLGDQYDSVVTKPMQLALKAGNEPLLKLQAEVRHAYRDADGTYRLTPREETEEIAARAVELGVDKNGQFRPGYGWLKALYSQFAQALRKYVPVPFTHAELQGLLVRALRHIEKAPAAERSESAYAFARGTPHENTLKALSEADELFQLPKSDKKDIEGIAHDNDPTLKVKELPSAIGNRKEWQVTFPDGQKATITLRPHDPNVEAHYDMTVADGDATRVGVERPGNGGGEVKKDDVWLDASQMTTGKKGAVLYNIAATFAHNTGRIFIGDPAGLSNEALRRRTEHMLSSALKFGTTEHLAPHLRQTLGDAKLGVPPLRWTYGDDLGNIESLLRVSRENHRAANPVTFERSSGRFVDSQGRELDDDALRQIARVGRAGEVGAGLTTLKRDAVLDSLVREESDQGAGRGGRNAVLEKLLELAREQPGPTSGIFYARGHVADEADTPERKPYDGPGAKAIEGANKFLDQVYMAIAPMSAGEQKAQAGAQQFVNDIRTARYQWQKISTLLKAKFTKAEREQMWNAADEENDLRRAAAQDANFKRPEGAGLDRLTDKQRAAMETLHTYGEGLWERAKAAGMVEGNGVHFWTPRVAVMVGENGEFARVPEPGKKATADGTGKNVFTTAPSAKARKHDTTTESEAALKAKLGENAQYVRDIMTMPLAMARFEQAIAGRELVNTIKDIGLSTGKELVNHTGGPGFFTLDHPAFSTWRPRIVDAEGGGKVALKDENGETVLDRAPIFIDKSWEGPLKAVMSTKDHVVYTGYMLLKSKAMTAIMYSPLIHNQVIFGRAMGYTELSKGGPLKTLALYFTGYAAKKDNAFMRQMISAGMVPIGEHNNMLDATDIAADTTREGTWLDPNESWIALGAKAAGDAVKDGAGDKIKTGLDAAGDFWHNTLLWRRIGDLQAGIARDAYDKLVSKGVDPEVASVAAAHLANRYAGAIGHENMSKLTHMAANVYFFSKSFNAANVGTVKDAAFGTTAGLKALIEERAQSPQEAKEVMSFLKNKARFGLARDLAYSVIAMNLASLWFQRDKDADWSMASVKKGLDRETELAMKGVPELEGASASPELVRPAKDGRHVRQRAGQGKPRLHGAAGKRPRAVHAPSHGQGHRGLDRLDDGHREHRGGKAVAFIRAAHWNLDQREGRRSARRSGMSATRTFAHKSGRRCDVPARHTRAGRPGSRPSRTSQRALRRRWTRKRPLAT